MFPGRGWVRAGLPVLLITTALVLTWLCSEPGWERLLWGPTRLRVSSLKSCSPPLLLFSLLCFAESFLFSFTSLFGPPPWEGSVGLLSGLAILWHPSHPLRLISCLTHLLQKPELVIHKVTPGPWGNRRRGFTHPEGLGCPPPPAA